jgi:pimeloyl-ACP methyl ester carboxylesterase
MSFVPGSFAPGTLELSGGSVAVLDTGAPPGPGGTALLVPGYTGSKEDFALILDALAGAGLRAVAMDQPGQYQSPGPARRSDYTTAWLGSVVNEVAASLDDRPVHLLGHSFGGLVARAAVLARPRLYRSLTLLCSGPAAIDGGRRELMVAMEPVARQGKAALYDALTAEVARRTPHPQSQPPPPLADFLRERFLASSLEGLFGMSEALTTEPDRVADLRATGVPVLVCFGEGDDAWPPAVQRDMARRLAARSAVIGGAGHSPAMEQPAQTARRLIEFWTGG